MTTEQAPNSGTFFAKALFIGATILESPVMGAAGFIQGLGDASEYDARVTENSLTKRTGIVRTIGGVFVYAAWRGVDAIVNSISKASQGGFMTPNDVFRADSPLGHR